MPRPERDLNAILASVPIRGRGKTESADGGSVDIRSYLRRMPRVQVRGAVETFSPAEER